MIPKVVGNKEPIRYESSANDTTLNLSLNETQSMLSVDSILDSMDHVEKADTGYSTLRFLEANSVLSKD